MFANVQKQMHFLCIVIVIRIDMHWPVCHHCRTSAMLFILVISQDVLGHLST